jgi:MFS transporter, ACS family, D-galactonate transporter
MKARVGNVRWGIAVLLGFGILIDYFDRTNMSVAIQPLMKEYGLSQGQMGIILSSFAWSYALLQIPMGAILDKIGVKWLMRVGTLLWAIATFSTAIVSGLGIIILFRIILGIAEAPAYPAAAKAVGYWFPIKERSLATSAFDGAAKLSNVLGVPLVALAVTEFGWRGGFWVTGILSLVYAIIFWIAYRDPSESKSLSENERQYIENGGGRTDETVEPGVSNSLSYLLRQRKVWGLSLGVAAGGYANYLFLTWLPGYLETQMHMSVLKSGIYTVLPWSIATLCEFVIGGWLVDKLIAKGNNPTKVRKSVLVIGMLFGLFVAGAAFTNNPKIAIVWISIALGGINFIAPVVWSLPGLIAPKGTVGSVTGIMNFLNNVAGIAAPIVTGFIAGGTGSFANAFITAGIVLLLGILSYVFLLGKIEQIPSQGSNKNEEVTSA